MYDIIKNKENLGLACLDRRQKIFSSQLDQRSIGAFLCARSISLNYPGVARNGVFGSRIGEWEETINLAGDGNSNISLSIYYSISDPVRSRNKNCSLMTSSLKTVLQIL